MGNWTILACLNGNKKLSKPHQFQRKLNDPLKGTIILVTITLRELFIVVIVILKKVVKIQTLSCLELSILIKKKSIHFMLLKYSFFTFTSFLVCAWESFFLSFFFYIGLCVLVFFG